MVHRKMILKKVISDFVCLSIVGIPILGFYIFGQPYHRGFFCSDESIRYPYHESTVSNTALYFVGLVLPIVVMVAVESTLRDRSDGVPTYSLVGYKIHPIIFDCYKAIGYFGFGAVTSQLTTDIGKYTIGRLRPHFMEVCKPNFNCSQNLNSVEYILNFECTGPNKKLIRDARLSFPSGHSSFSFYCMVYLALYLHARLPSRSCRLWKHFFQFFCIMLAWGTALSRVSNYKHHFSDVIAGGIIGVLTAVLTSFFVSDLFKVRKTVQVNGATEVNLNYKSNEGPSQGMIESVVQP